MIGALDHPAAAPPPAPRRAIPQPCAVALSRAIEALEDATLAPDALDAAVWRALGWQTKRIRVSAHTTTLWMQRGPAAATWSRMARPSRDLDAAALVVPWRWSWGAGVKNGPPHGWCALRLPIEQGVPFFECGGTTPARALLKAALFAQRWQAMERNAAPQVSA